MKITKRECKHNFTLKTLTTVNVFSILYLEINKEGLKRVNMNILNKIKDILHIEHHPKYTTRIIHTESDEYAVQIWDSFLFGIFQHWQNSPYVLNDADLKENRFVYLADALERKRLIDDRIEYMIKKNKIKNVIDFMNV